MTDMHPKRPRDANQLAKAIIDEATGQTEPPTDVRDPEAVKRGRLGGQKRAARLTPEERSQAARKAVQTRWRRS